MKRANPRFWSLLVPRDIAHASLHISGSNFAVSSKSSSLLRCYRRFSKNATESLRPPYLWRKYNFHHVPQLWVRWNYFAPSPGCPTSHTKFTGDQRTRSDVHFKASNATVSASSELSHVFKLSPPRICYGVTEFSVRSPGALWVRDFFRFYVGNNKDTGGERNRHYHQAVSRQCL